MKICLTAATGGIVDHPYFDVTEVNPAFTIDVGPEVTYTIHTWHEVDGELT